MAGVYSAPTRLVYGPGALGDIGPLADELGITRALIVTDPGIRRAGLVDRVCDALAAGGIESAVFDHIETNPSAERAEEAVAVYRQSGATGLVALGGGSALDIAKCTGLLATNPGDLSDYIGVGKVKAAIPPLLAIPTTVGTGSEVTPYAVVTDEVLHKKLVIGSPYIAPPVALLDPEVVSTLPARLVAASSLDALTHAIEAVISVHATPFSDGHALEAIHLIFARLIEALDPEATEARGVLLYASTLAGLAFSTARVGLVHGMSHPVSSYYGTHHGLANAILLPYVLEFNLPACEDEIRLIGRLIGEEDVVEAIHALRERAGIPAHLRDVGVDETHLEAVTTDAYESHNAQTVNPRRPTRDEVRALYLAALG